MARPIVWFRWYRGKVWHVAFVGDVAACGQDVENYAEQTHTFPPTNARICVDCVAAASGIAVAAQGAADADPRFRADPLPEG